MQTSRKFTQVLLAMGALLLMASAAMAQVVSQGPGQIFPYTSEINDQKAGSILFFNIYASSTANPGTQNTRFSITNTSSTSPAFVHLFFVEGNSCNIADRFICLTPNQTSTFTAAEQDPGTVGYLVAIAADPFGCPTNFNHLIGDEYVKFETGHFANLAAESISAIAATPTDCTADSISTVLNFNGTAYNRVPAVLAIDNIGAPADGNVVRLWVNRVGGSLISGAASIGTIFGLLYNDQEEPFSFTVTGNGCQRGATLSNNFPRVVPRFDVIIPAGQTGWLKFWATPTQVGILGASINFNANAGTGSGAFNGGKNMHKLRLTTDAYTIPIFPPAC
jgi:hypothetical protein